MALVHLDETQHRALDDELHALWKELTRPGVKHKAVADRVRAIIESVEGRLLRPTWRETWHNEEFVASGWFIDPQTRQRVAGGWVVNPEKEKQEKALLTVFTEIVRFSEDSTNDHLRQEYGGQLARALAGYLSLRGRPVGKEPLKPPPPEAVAAYRLKWVSEISKQDQIAKILTKEFGREIRQYQVSRWLRDAENWVSSGGVLPMPEQLDPRPDPRKATPLDPTDIDMGARVEDRGRAKRQRKPPDDD